MLVLLFAPILHPADVRAYQADTPQQNVLILHSYHKGFSWTDNQNDGIEERLKSSKAPPVIYTEYLDWKRYPNQDNLQRFYELIKGKYSKLHIDAIITTDDRAFDFAVKNREELLDNAPIIFSGINEVGYDQIKDHKNITGVIENIDPSETIKMALYINPSIRNVYLVYDNSESGLSTAQLVIKKLKLMHPELKLHSMNQLSEEEIDRTVASLPSDSILLATTFYSDVTGRVTELDRFSSGVAAISTVPLYYMYEYGLNHGAFGGNLLSGKLLGEKAANVALRVLSGESPDRIAISYAGTSRNVFDYNQLERFHVKVKDLPPGSEVINKPFSFYETYRSFVLILIAMFSVLIVFIAVLLFHVSVVRRIRKQLAESNERFTLAAYGADAVIWDLDMTTMTYYFSDRWYELLGYEIGELDEFYVGWSGIIHPEDFEQEDRQRRDHLTGRTAYYYSEYRIRAKSGEYKWFQARGKVLRNEEGGYVRFAGSMTDVTDLKGYESKLQMSYQELESTYEELTALQDELLEQYNKVVENQALLQASEEKHRLLAYSDGLSGLPNRLSLTEELKEYIEKNEDGKAALYFLDIDNFKYINDTMGHTFGDRLLMLAGERLLGRAPDQSRHYRFGGDEFVILLKNMERAEQTVFYAEALIQSFKEPFQLGDSTVHVSISVGIAQYPRDGKSAEELLKNADIAMYRAKQAGKGTYVLYGQNMQRHFDERMIVEKHLRGAIDNNELFLNYQPKVYLHTGELWGFEALIRWNSPDLGFVSPLSFIRIAEDCRLIVPIGEWVLRRACLFLAGLHRQGRGPYHISVNISVIQLLLADFADTVLRILRETGLDPRYLELEITESIFMESFEEISTKLEYLKKWGIGIALDDFGTGYSSLSYLKQLPITTLKIDKSFIDSIPDENSSMPLAGSIIAIGHDMGLSVTAEGVETKEQLDFLETMKCDKVQGYYISRPIPENQVKSWIRQYEQEKLDAREPKRKSK
ncbi:diguanylate cyclase (GGDEF)-like protein/PAS domain S-box-containing protein [Paenibacillus forsythiae]|uniref:Diguanylate cyclase (GGDEF)-like protein/PAS domain S-box-containing protein n=1 Tax=Paenibacillus forsythiae TaxID=365616 RepID=A0ABU3H3U6_9BACL|nr:ABC transporter substrate binding protein [Paenibacillus forsythiae]MDT3425420.1 diguanylate cyclase (GGDEF)-like protein/PAS domain S-box-containing protein [Paenibacillus forsythiae]